MVNVRHRLGGFTLIELIVVLVLVGLLVSIAAPRYFHVIDSGRASVQRQNVAVIRDAIDKYYGDLGHYPDSLEDLVAKHYLREVPVDPLTGQTDWVVAAPPEGNAGNVFDVKSAQPPADSASAPGGNS
jgi:general secretion pathway protein G